MLGHFLHHQRPHAIHGGHLPAVVYFNAIETDQQMQALAQLNRKMVQDLGSSSEGQLAKIGPRSGDRG